MRQRARVEQDGLVAFADLGQESEVLHVPGADLDDVDCVQDHLDMPRVQSSVTSGSPVSSRASSRIRRASPPSP